MVFSAVHRRGRVNVKKGGVTAENIERQRDEFACLGSSLSIVMRHAEKFLARVLIELPASCG